MFALDLRSKPIDLSRTSTEKGLPWDDSLLVFKNIVQRTKLESDWASDDEDEIVTGPWRSRVDLSEEEIPCSSCDDDDVSEDYSYDERSLYHSQDFHIFPCFEDHQKVPSPTPPVKDVEDQRPVSSGKRKNQVNEIIEDWSNELQTRVCDHNSHPSWRLNEIVEDCDLDYYDLIEVEEDIGGRTILLPNTSIEECGEIFESDVEFQIFSTDLVETQIMTHCITEDEDDSIVRPPQELDSLTSGFDRNLASVKYPRTGKNGVKLKSCTEGRDSSLMVEIEQRRGETTNILTRDNVNVWAMSLDETLGIVELKESSKSKVSDIGLFRELNGGIQETTVNNETECTNLSEDLEISDDDDLSLTIVCD